MGRWGGGEVGEVGEGARGRGASHRILSTQILDPPMSYRILYVNVEGKRCFIFCLGACSVQAALRADR